MGTLRRITKKYSKKCKEANLKHLLNWKSESWNRVKGLEGEVFDTKLGNIELPSGEKCENYLHQIIDKEFPETIRDCFTKSLFKYKYDEKLGKFKKTPELIEEVFTEGNTVQMWKLLDKMGSTGMCRVLYGIMKNLIRLDLMVILYMKLIKFLT